jgi:hypothetical protein
LTTPGASIWRAQSRVRLFLRSTSKITDYETIVFSIGIPPDVVILDLRVAKDGLPVITELISSRRPKPRIIVLTTYRTERYGFARSVLVREATMIPLPLGFVRRKPRIKRILPFPRIRSGSRIDIG